MNDVDHAATQNAAKKSELEARSTNRSRTPHSAEFLAFIGGQWDDAAATLTDPEAAATAGAAAQAAATRRAKVAERFAGQLVVIRAGGFKQRSNDTDYRYRPHSAFAHLTGWGTATVPDSVLVIDARDAGVAGDQSHREATSTLFFRPTAGHGTDEFFANPTIGEFWVGNRPNLLEVSNLLNISTRDLAEFETFIEGASNVIDLDFEEVAEFVSELRLIKDDFEIGEMRKAVAASVKGFENVVRALPAAISSNKGERVVETAFYSAARIHGNDLGYDTIAASGEHACILHWIINDGQTRSGDLILVDAGVEVDSLYTADITRTLPLNGKFSPAQREVYEAVLEAADAAFAVAKPGVKFREIHAAAMKVIARHTAAWGLLPVSAEESLEVEKQFHRRFMVHGTSHHLGIDVHDCAQARREMYLDAELEPGMVFTIEPGLYFHAGDQLAPERFKGIGVRIEDNVLVTATGVENLSAALPRKIEEIETWMEALQA
jgi:Xaa-Pro aminopeptidase